MKLILNESDFGFYITTHDFKLHNVREDIPEGAFIVLKEKEEIEDLGRTVIQTSYGYIENDTYYDTDKRTLSEMISKKVVEYIAKRGTVPYKINLKKELKENKPVYLLWDINEYDQFHLKITDMMLGEGNTAYETFKELFKQNKIAKVDESIDPWKVEYAKSGRSTCRSCNKKIAKDAVRLGEPSYFQGHVSYKWHHEDCANYITIQSIENLEGLEDLEKEDKERIEAKLA